MYRVMKAGRLMSVHCMDVPAMKERDGYIGLKDFPGELCKVYQDAGFILHSRVTIWKNPVAEMTRTKALGLLHKQIRKDSTMCRQGCADYILTFRKPGENADPVSHTMETFPVAVWQRYASPVWMDIKQKDTLNYKIARANEDEKHVCFAQGTLVLTKRGYVPIESINVEEDMVLTNGGTLEKVVAKALTKNNASVVRTKATGVPNLISTPDHKLMGKQWNGSKPNDSICNVSEDWVEAKDANNHFLKFVLPPVVESDISADEWWIIGRYLADGNIDSRKHQFFISVGNNKWEDFVVHAKDHIGSYVDRGSCTQVGLINLSKSARNVLHKCGYVAKEKTVPFEGISLNKELSKALFDGYFSGDGHTTKKNIRTITSISRSLLLGMQIVLQRAYGKSSSIFDGRDEGDGVICGRHVHNNKEWVMSYSETSNTNVVDGNVAWKRVRSVEDAGTADVWSVEVENDHSYIAEGCVVKNCPLNTEVVKRCIELWSNRGDVVLDPFAGIGTVPYMAVRLGRVGLGIELKDSYYKQAVINCDDAVNTPIQIDLFGEIDRVVGEDEYNI